jgi:CDP-glycerol glycerophosphotransferase (TagB/SpsB family)
MTKSELIDEVITFYPTWRGDLELMTKKELERMIEDYHDAGEFFGIDEDDDRNMCDAGYPENDVLFNDDGMTINCKELAELLSDEIMVAHAHFDTGIAEWTTLLVFTDGYGLDFEVILTYELLKLS